MGLITVMGEMVMGSNQLQQLATDVELNHWPPHLGVRTDAEKIEYLAQRLREAAGKDERIEELEDEVNQLEDRNSQLAQKLEDADDNEDMVKDLREDVADLKSKLSEIRNLTL